MTALQSALQSFERALAATDDNEKIRFYSEFIRLNAIPLNPPDYAENAFVTAVGFNNRGDARYAKGDLEGAIKDYTEAIRLKPDYAAFYNRGIARKAKGDLKERSRISSKQSA